MRRTPVDAVRAVLFDLDGTLLDTAPDLAAALNQVRTHHGLTEMTLADIRPQVSNGSYALTALGCPAPPDSELGEEFRQALLRHYAENVAVSTTLFEGMDVVLATLEGNNIPWGIVTNKPARFTGPLLEQLGLGKRAAVVISGDTIEEKKPHPAPLILAAKRLRVESENCIYIGDAERDVIAGNAAGMRTVIAMYGYIPDGEDPGNWGADSMIEQPLEMVKWVKPK